MALLTLRALSFPRAGRWLAATVGLLASAALLAAAAAPSRETQIKVVYLFNFAQYVTWAPEAFADPMAPLVIGVLGEDTLGAALDEAVHGETVKNHPLVVQRFQRVEDIQVCHILFISRSEGAGIDRILRSLKGRSVLTVSDADKFAVRGGVIRFVMENNKVRLLVNLEAAKAARLTVSSKLLRLAEIVAQAND